MIINGIGGAGYERLLEIAVRACLHSCGGFLVQTHRLERKEC